MTFGGSADASMCTALCFVRGPVALATATMLWVHAYSSVCLSVKVTAGPSSEMYYGFEPQRFHFFPFLCRVRNDGNCDIGLSERVACVGQSLPYLRLYVANIP